MRGGYRALLPAPTHTSLALASAPLSRRNPHCTSWPKPRGHLRVRSWDWTLWQFGRVSVSCVPRYTTWNVFSLPPSPVLCRVLPFPPSYPHIFPPSPSFCLFQKVTYLEPYSSFSDRLLSVGNMHVTFLRVLSGPGSACLLSVDYYPTERPGHGVFVHPLLKDPSVASTWDCEYVCCGRPRAGLRGHRTRQRLVVDMLLHM